jgi:GT2 family glycosyltransferase
MKYQIQYDTAVVILSFNGKKWHEKFLPLIVAEAQNNYDVVIIDNASTDNTSEFIRVNFPNIHIISIPINKGFTGGYNYGLKQIDSKYFVLLSADFEVTKDWFLPLHQLMESNNNIAACMPKIKYYHQKEMFEYAGACGGFLDILGYSFCRGRIFDNLEEDKGQYNTPMEIFWAGGGCLFIRANLFIDNGGFEEHFFCTF